MTLRQRPTPEEVQQAWADDQTAKVRELLPRLDWHKLWKDEEDIEWLVEPIWPERALVALYSPAGIGKSLLMLELGAGLSCGREVLGHKPSRRYRVLYIDFENDPIRDIRDRLQNMEYGPGDLDHLDFLSYPTLAHLDSPTGASELLAAVEAYGSEVVVIDTISRAVAGEENDNDTWLNFYKYTGLALKQRGVALIRLDHTGKDVAKGERGGSAKAGDVDAAWRLSEIEEGVKYRLTNTKTRFRLEEREITIRRHDDPLRHTLEDTSKRDDRESRIWHIIQLADKDGLPKDTGRDRFLAWAVKQGLTKAKGPGRDIGEIIRRRKKGELVPFVYQKPVDNPQKPVTDPPLQVPGPEPVTDPRNGYGTDTSFPLVRPVTSNGNRPVTGTEVAPVPVPSSLREGTGDSPEPKPGDEPCAVCGKPLGYAMVRRDLTVHVPGCSEVMR